ncbi:Hypothetical protein PHPALM_8428 [Phytophthora palmivora]|uniref:Chromo domain-containing protein n=1 Tax=Phytophthora palmivora TaxID=4796 RepID=A0A2P4Y9V0_9STRA|nr:Hypothetical protein PHPALM_8428 [Phytophthora palmivora]
MLLGVEKFKSHRFNDALRRWELLVSWIGLTDNEDSWESASEMQKDVSAKVNDYMEHVQDEELSKALQASTDAS